MRGGGETGKVNGTGRRKGVVGGMSRLALLLKKMVRRRMRGGSSNGSSNSSIGRRGGARESLVER